MKQQLNELKRMQQLAGIINESNNADYDFDDSDKALGILFYPNTDGEEGYEWDMDAFNNLVKNMGYEDYEDVAGEMTHIFSPADEDEMRIFRQRLNNPNLQPEDLTIGMYKQTIEQEFPDKFIK
jgi:hypothetical protein